MLADAKPVEPSPGPEPSCDSTSSLMAGLNGLELLPVGSVAVVSGLLGLRWWRRRGCHHHLVKVAETHPRDSQRHTGLWQFLVPEPPIEALLHAVDAGGESLPKWHVKRYRVLC